MDLYHTEDVTGEELLDTTDVEAFKASVAQEAVESGFAQSVADNVKEIWLNSESYEEFCEEIGADLNADDVEIKAKTKTNNQKKEKVEKELPIKEIRVDVSPKLKHFEGHKNGVHIGLTVVVELSVSSQENMSIQAMTLSLQVSATFEQEVRVEPFANAHAVWGWWGIFPYIKDYNISTGIKIYDYSGIGLEVQPQLGVGDGNEYQAYADYFRKAMEEGFTNISSNSGVQDALADATGYTYDDDMSVAKGLGKRYAAMLDDIDWVPIIKHRMFEFTFNLLLLFDVQISVDFVIEGEFVLVTGFNYWYKCGKQYSITIKLFKLKIESEVSDLVPEQKSFNAYVMGSAGLRAMLEVAIKIGCFIGDCAYMGFAIDLGGYFNIHALVYYQKDWYAGEAVKANTLGNFLFEAGLIVQLKVLAHLSGVGDMEEVLFEKTYPLLRIGRRDMVVDFALEQKDLPVVNLKGIFTASMLPSELYRMQYLDMVDGVAENGEYFEKTYHSENFSYEISNPAFTYDPITKCIIVKDTTSSPVQDGELTITFKATEGYMCKKPIQRKVKIHWDRFRDGYYIAFNSNGGTSVPMIYGKWNTPVVKPANPTRPGYTFAGWYTNENLTGFAYTIPNTIPDDDHLLFAKWNANDAYYTVKTYLQETDGTYTLNKEERLISKTDNTVTPVPTAIEGYVTPTPISERVEWDGSTEIEYYYGLQSYDITFTSADELVSGGSYKYGTGLLIPTAKNPGYNFVGWKYAGTPDSAILTGTQLATVPARNTEYAAVWEAATDIPYEIRYYYQNANDSGNTLAKIIERTGCSDEEIIAEPLSEQEAVGYTLRDGKMPTAKVLPDGSSVLRVYYDRLTFDVTCKLNNNQEDVKLEGIRQGASVVPETPVRPGYDFIGWYTDKECTKEFDFIMPMNDITLYAKWEKGNVVYRIENYLQNAPESEEYTLFETTQATAKAETESEIKYNTYTGYAVKDAGNVTPAADGTTVCKVYYDLESYTLTVNLNDGNEATETQLYYCDTLPTYDREDYIFAGWFTDETLTQEYNGNMPAQDLAVYAKWEESGTPVTVRYRMQNANSEEYDVVDVKYLVCTPETVYEAVGIDYAGFVTPETQSVDVFDTPITVDLDYVRDSVEVVYDYGYQVEGIEKTETESVKYGTANNNTPERAGYQFLGWYTDDALTTRFTGEFNDDITLYASWQAVTVMYTVEHYVQNSDGSYSLTDEDILYEKSGTEVTPKLKSYDHCLVPKKQTAVVEGDESLVVAYKYALETYQVTYVQDNGEKNINVINRYTQNVINPVVEKKGYTFITWYGSDKDFVTVPNNMPDKSLEYTAQWDINVYDVVYNLAGGEASTANPTSYTVEDDTFTLNNPTKYGYEFLGWSGTDIADKSLSVTVPQGSVGKRIYTANWKPITYTITLDAKGGSVGSATVQYTIESPTFNLETPTYKGFTFNGWKLNNTGNAMKTVAITHGTTGNYSYTASRTENEYTVKYTIAGTGASEVTSGTTDSFTKTVKYTQQFNLEGTNVFKRIGYTFLGWSTSSTATSAAYIANQSVSGIAESGTITLYPVWQANKYNVIFHYNNGAADTTEYNKYYDETFYNNPTRAYYVFKGWSEYATDGKTSSSFVPSGTLVNLTPENGKTVELWAMWEPVTHIFGTYTFDGNDGRGIKFEDDDIVLIGKDTIDTLSFGVVDGHSGSAVFVPLDMSFNGIRDYGYTRINYYIKVYFDRNLEEARFKLGEYWLESDTGFEGGTGHQKFTSVLAKDKSSGQIHYISGYFDYEAVSANRKFRGIDLHLRLMENLTNVTRYINRIDYEIRFTK